MNTIRTGTFAARSLSVLLLQSCVLNAQCTIGTNQSTYLLTAEGYNAAWPKDGSRVKAGATWINMLSSGIQYIYCPSAANSGCLPSPEGGDSNFTGSQITSMESAFSAWIATKSVNGSDLNFNRIFTSTYGTDPFVIAIKSMSPSAMGINLARVVTNRFEMMDYDSDGIGDAVRRADVIIEVRSNVTTDLTAVMVHELGHTFGLEDWTTCNNTTIMRSPILSGQATAPSECDIEKVLGLFQ